MSDAQIIIGSILIFFVAVGGMMAVERIQDRRRIRRSVIENPNWVPIEDRKPKDLRPAALPVKDESGWDEAVVAELIIAPALVPSPLTPCPVCGKEFKQVSQHYAKTHVCQICGREYKRAAQHQRMVHAKDMTMKENQSERVHPLPE